MSRRFTEIHLPHSRAGLGEWDEQPAEVMIAKMRAYAADLRAQAEAVERAADHEFQIQSYTGVHVQRNRREIQKSSRLRHPAESGAGVCQGSEADTAQGKDARDAPNPPTPSTTCDQDSGE